MTAEQELNLLANKYGEIALTEAAKDYISKVKSNEEKQHWDTLCLSYGLKPEDFNRQFTDGKNVFFLRAIKPNNRKYPIIAERTDGRMYKFTVDILKSYLRGSV